MIPIVLSTRQYQNKEREMVKKRIKHLTVAISVITVILYFRNGQSLNTQSEHCIHTLTQQPILRPNMSRSTLLTNPRFQLVKGLDQELYVYSALRDKYGVRIVSLKRQGEDIRNMLCVVYSTSTKSILKVMKASVSQIREGYGRVYSAAYITCDGRKRHKTHTNVNISIPPTEWSSSSAATSVGLLKADGKGIVLVSLPVEGGAPGRLDKPNEMVEFTVCGPPMFGAYNNEAQLVENIEMVRLLGAARVVLYNTSVSPGVDAILKWYQHNWHEESGFTDQNSFRVVVRPFDLQFLLHDNVSRGYVVKEDVLHANGQMASIDDCLNLYRWQSRYIVFTDLDELAIPVHHENWSQLIAHRRSVEPTATAFMFLSTQVKKQETSPAKGFETEAMKYKSAVLAHTRRDDFIHKKLKQSKMIVDPRYVQMMGVHFTWKPEKVHDVVPTDEGLLYHYRDLPSPEYPSDSPQVEDRTVSDKFGKRLADRLKVVWSSILKNKNR